MPDLSDALNQLEGVRQTVDEAKDQIDDELSDYESLIRELDSFAPADLNVTDENVQAFAREPYCIVPTGEEEWRVVVPKFVDYRVGILEQTTDAWNIFKVNKYAKWLHDIPEDLEERFHFHDDLDAEFDPDTRKLELGSREERDEAWERYRDHLWKRAGPRSVVANQGKEFDLVADLVDDGTLPFKPEPVDSDDLRDPQFKVGNEIELRDYQEEAWTEFREKGAIGVYWMPGSGKTYLGLYALARLRGKKLVIVPNRTLVEQWNERIQDHIAAHDNFGTGPDVEVLTYHAWDKLRRRMKKRNWEEPTLVIFDECHRLPANTFSKFSTLPTKYRIGLSATPYREDGRTDLIFALTGFPVGLDWERLLDLGVAEKPGVRLHIVEEFPDKKQVLDDLVDTPDKTLVFCDSLDHGETLARRYDVPFISGDTSERLEKVRNHDLTICSRVGDEGLSVEDLDRVVEYDFLGGSRRQEGQRMGRLMHGEDKGQHYVIMTRKELSKFEDRLLAIRDKGIQIDVTKHNGSPS